MTANAPERPQTDDDYDQDDAPTTAEALADRVTKLDAEIEEHWRRLGRR